MTIVLALIGFFFGFAVDGIWIGLLCGAAGWGIGYWIKQQQGEPSSGSWEETDARASRQTRESGDEAPNLEDPLQLRAHVRALTRRVAKLESEIARLTQSEATSAPTPAPVEPEAPEVHAEAVVPIAHVESVTQAHPYVAPVVEETPTPSIEAATSRPESPGIEQPKISKPAPATPSFWERLIGGNLVAKAGIVILFFGVAFLLRYAYEHTHIPIEFRLLGVAIGGIALLLFGWQLRKSRPPYALALQGGGVGVLYLVIFGAFRLYQLLPAPLAFGMLGGIAAFSAVLAVAQNSLALAALGVSGGFLAPVLASTGHGSHVMLFSYYAVLNAAIVAIAWVRAWRLLNLLGFGFTFVIGWLWGQSAYRSEHFTTTEPFLILFFLMYVVIPLLFARQRAAALTDYVDGTLVFGVPLVAFGLQVALVRDFEYGAAWSALALAAFYMAMAYVLIRKTSGSLGLIAEAYLALGVAFGTLAVPLAFEGRLTSAAWALEGAAIVWIGLRQRRLLARAFGYALQFAAGGAFLQDVGASYGTTPVLNSFYLGCLFVAAGGLFCSWYVNRNRDLIGDGEKMLAPLFLAWGALWWFGGGIHEIHRHIDWPASGQAALLFIVVSSIVASLASNRLAWPMLRWLCLVLYPAMLIQIAHELMRGAHPFAGIGAAGWIAAFAAHLWVLARHGSERTDLAQFLHAAGVWLLALVGAREIGWQIDQAVEGRRVWPAISWAIVPAALLFAVRSRALRAHWPIAEYPKSYVVWGAVPLAIFLALWIVYANFTNNGDPYPLPYLPLLNPLDVAIAAVFVVVARWLGALSGEGLEAWWTRSRNGIFVLFGIIGFIWVNGILLRTLHHWADLPFALRPMLESRLVQASFSILWTLLALGAMVLATRHAMRSIWMVGAGLMAAVVAKLFVVDLSGIGTIERIVSFIGVGLLMLVVGYLSPVPPKENLK